MALISATLDAISTEWEALGWERVHEPHTPVDSTPQHKTFAFGEGRRQGTISAGTSKAVALWTVPVRAVYHADTESEHATGLDALGALQRAIDLAVAWPAGVWSVQVRIRGGTGVTRRLNEGSGGGWDYSFDLAIQLEEG